MRDYASSSRKHLLQDAREDTLTLVTFLFILLGSFLAILDRATSPPPSLTALGMLVLLLGAAVALLRGRSESAAAWLLTLGLLTLVPLVLVWFPGADVYPLLLLPAVIGMLTFGASAALVAAGLATIALFLAFPGADSASLLWATGGLLWAVVLLLTSSGRSQASVLTHLWQNYAESQQLLEEARDRQVQLKQALEDLDLANREVMRLNDLLTAAREAVEEARRTKEEFVANVSHELRTPLNMIIGFSDEILQRPQFYADGLPDDLLDDVASIRRNSAHLANLVDDVLDLVEADTGFTRLNKSWTSMEEIIREAVEAVDLFFEKKEVQLSVNVPADLPPVHCDHIRIRQVVLNLLSNAARFTQQGITRVTACEQDGNVIISVSDTGPGMDAATIHRLFEPFQQADPSIRRRYGGTGLGLTISKRFLEMHGGHIWIESEVGVGTTVFFSLPVQQQQSATSPRRWFSPYQEYEPRTQPSLAPRDRPAPQVVVQEQGRVLSDLIRHYLPELEVTTVQPSELEKVIKTEAMIALVLNQMPGNDAGNASHTVPQMVFDVPIFSCWVPEREAGMQASGVEDYLVKPIQRPELMSSIQRIAPEARRILLVEDDTEARQLFGRMLAAPPHLYEVMPAADGEEGMRLMREWGPDLVLLDLIMPGMDGFAVLAAKADEEPIRDIPVIVISAKDPQREPIMSSALTLRRQQGLSARDLTTALGAIIAALPPRFAAPARSEALRMR
jgi:signal transduction histidine kinase/CheY-like chemotaxis protein